MKNLCGFIGCKNFIQSETAINFICRDHVPQGSDEVRFQDVQFDPDIYRGVIYSVEWEELDQPARAPYAHINTRPPIIDREQDDISDIIE